MVLHHGCEVSCAKVMPDLALEFLVVPEHLGLHLVQALAVSDPCSRSSKSSNSIPSFTSPRPGSSLTSADRDRNKLSFLHSLRYSIFTSSSSCNIDWGMAWQRLSSFRTVRRLSETRSHLGDPIDVLGVIHMIIDIQIIPPRLDYFDLLQKLGHLSHSLERKWAWQESNCQ